jgi:PhnB protein
MTHAHPHFIIRETARAMEWYKKALGATEVVRYTAPDGVIVYGEMKLGDSKLSMSEENLAWHNAAPPSLGGTPVVVHLDVDDAHAVGKRMVELGAKIIFPIEDQFYGDRQGRLEDPFGHVWVVTQSIEKLSPEEIQRRVDNFKP